MKKLLLTTVLLVLNAHAYSLSVYPKYVVIQSGQKSERIALSNKPMHAKISSGYLRLYNHQNNCLLIYYLNPSERPFDKKECQTFISDPYLISRNGPSVEKKEEACEYLHFMEGIDTFEITDSESAYLRILTLETVNKLSFQQCTQQIKVSVKLREQKSNIDFSVDSKSRNLILNFDSSHLNTFSLIDFGCQLQPNYLKLLSLESEVENAKGRVFKGEVPIERYFSLAARKCTHQLKWNKLKKLQEENELLKLKNQEDSLQYENKSKENQSLIEATEKIDQESKKLWGPEVYDIVCSEAEPGSRKKELLDNIAHVQSQIINTENENKKNKDIIENQKKHLKDLEDKIHELTRTSPWAVPFLLANSFASVAKIVGALSSGMHPIVLPVFAYEFWINFQKLKKFFK